jgi:hypothetical protein
VSPRSPRHVFFPDQGEGQDQQHRVAKKSRNAMWMLSMNFRSSTPRSPPCRYCRKEGHCKPHREHLPEKAHCTPPCLTRHHKTAGPPNREWHWYSGREEPKPTPRKRSIPDKRDEEPASRNVRRKSPATVTAIPPEATSPGSMLSESFLPMGRRVPASRVGHEDQPGILGRESFGDLEVEREEEGDCVGCAVVDQGGEVREGKDRFPWNNCMLRTGEGDRSSKAPNTTRRTIPVSYQGRSRK